MATRDLGAGDLGPGSITGSGLQQGGVGASSILGSPGAFQGALDSAIQQATAFDIHNRDHVRYLQTILTQAGFNPGPIDGVWGPRTEAANNAWNAAGRPTAPAAPTTSNVPATISGPVGVQPLIASPTRTPDRVGQVDPNYRALDAFLAVPEIARLVADARANRWTNDELMSRFVETNWWKSTTPTERYWMALEAADPGEARMQLEEQAIKVQEAARAYLLPMSQEGAQHAARQLLSGKVTAEAYRLELVEQAKSLYGTRNPHLARALDQGRTVADYAHAFVELAAVELEVSPDMVDLMDPKWHRPVSEGMTLYDWQRTIRSDPAYGWDRTPTARTRAAEIGTTIAKAFGAVG